MEKSELYVIGISHDDKIWYYVGPMAHDGSKLAPVNRYSSALIDAKEYKNYNDAKKAVNNEIPKEYIKWVMRVYECPQCKRKYVGYPALSRKDNKTEICPDCGMREAIDIAIKNGLAKRAK